MDTRLHPILGHTRTLALYPMVKVCFISWVRMISGTHARVVEQEMTRSHGMSTILRRKWDIDSVLVAIERITGASVAFIRPRKSTLFLFSRVYYWCSSIVAYGNYNDNVRQVAENLGETVVIWDLEYVLAKRVKCGATNWPGYSLQSSGDSTGASVEQQKAQYSDAAARHPKNVLSLQHDVHSA